MELWARMRNVFGCDELNNRNIWRMLIAEFVGTLFLVLIGCSSCVKGWDKQEEIITKNLTKELDADTIASIPTDFVQVALTFGLTIATMAQAFGHVSGGHFNPAVTVAFLVTGKITIAKSIFYIISQCMGSICGAALLQALTPPVFHSTLGVTRLNEALTPTQGFGVEFFTTFTLVMVVFGVCDKHRTDVKGSAPLAIGLCISTAILATAQYTGGSLNPARSLGPALIANKWQYHWVYWAGPIVGGMVAALLYEKVFRASSPEEELESVEYQYRAANTKENEVIADRTTTI